MGLTSFSAAVQRLWERWLHGEELLPSPKVGLQSSEYAELNKIDGAATNGLWGVEDSLAYRVAEIEDHIHSVGHFYGQSAGDTFFEENNLTPWVITAGAGEAFGDWLQVSNGDEISNPKYDPHLLCVSSTSSATAIYLVQFGAGESGAQVVIGSAWFKASATLRSAPEEVQARRVDNTDKLWLRCKSTVELATISVIIGLHTYPG
jgi:hypothetical protein